VKLCRGCDTIKPLGAFGAEKRTNDGLRQKCKVCRKAYRLQPAQTIVRRTYDRQRPARPKDKTKQRQYSASYYEKNQVVRQQYSKQYKKSNKGKTNALNQKRAAEKIQRTPKWLSKLQLSRIEIFYDTAVRLTVEFNKQMHVDHIIPLKGKAVSGLHVPWNLQVITAVDNQKKSNKVAA
jgi:hypothetical protein